MFTAVTIGCTRRVERVMIFTSATWDGPLHTSAYYRPSPDALLSLCACARSLQSLGTELTTVPSAINHPDKSVSPALMLPTGEGEKEKEYRKEENGQSFETYLLAETEINVVYWKYFLVRCFCCIFVSQ